MADQDITTQSGSMGATGANMLLRFLTTQFVMAARNWGGPLRFTMDVSGALEKMGQKVGVRVAPNVTSRLLNDGSAKVLDDDTGTTVDVTLNRTRYTAFGVTEVEQAMDGRASNPMLISSRVSSLLNGIEQDVMSVASTSFTTNTAQGTYNTALTEAAFGAAVSQVLDQAPPNDGNIVAMVRSGATSYDALLTLPSFSYALNTGLGVGAQVSQNMGVGRPFHGAWTFMSQAMPKNGTSTDNLIFHRSAIAVAMRNLDVPPDGLGVLCESVTDVQSGVTFQVRLQYDKDRMATEFVCSVLYGYAVVAPQYGCLLKS